MIFITTYDSIPVWRTCWTVSQVIIERILRGYLLNVIRGKRGKVLQLSWDDTQATVTVIVIIEKGKRRGRLLSSAVKHNREVEHMELSYSLKWRLPLLIVCTMSWINATLEMRVCLYSRLYYSQWNVYINNVSDSESDVTRLYVRHKEVALL